MSRWLEISEFFQNEVRVFERDRLFEKVMPEEVTRAEKSAN